MYWGDYVEAIISYARDAAEAFKYYVSINGIDECSKKMYQFIQNINNLSDEDKVDLDLFISENTVDVKHLADITYISESRQEGIFNSLMRMKPFKVSKPEQRFCEARGNGLQIVKSNTKETVKVFKRTYPKNMA